MPGPADLRTRVRPGVRPFTVSHLSPVPATRSCRSRSLFPGGIEKASAWMLGACASIQSRPWPATELAKTEITGFSSRPLSGWTACSAVGSARTSHQTGIPHPAMLYYLADRCAIFPGYILLVLLLGSCFSGCYLRTGMTCRLFIGPCELASRHHHFPTDNPTRPPYPPLCMPNVERSLTATERDSASHCKETSYMQTDM
ncbi:hypothetical protein GE09DRAFT_242623 [Coniochaeta sp. 2T2.1]|nr:hypothetical protein GE09DRAFT_242623 [Coniochaeta sp. 2T2.1]